MSLMAREITDELHNESSLSIGAAFNALRQKFNINWIQLNPKSKDVEYSSSYSSPPISSEADRTAPTKAELFLLICSLFPTDFKLPIEDLVVYGMALKLFGDVCDISEVKGGVYNLIKIINHQLPPRYLNKLCPWEDKYGSQYVIVFSCAKDLAKSIASKYRLVLGCNENVNGYWPNTNRYEYFYGLSLVLERINKHPTSFGCPQLQQRDDSESSLVDVFAGVKELMILSLDIPVMPESLSVLWNLRTLHLNMLKLEDIPWSCLMNLEFLSIFTPTLTDIPMEMGQLVNLRLLDLRKMSIAYIPPGVLSKMLKLKELYFPVGFQRWGCCEKEIDDFDEWESWEENDNDDKEKNEVSNRQIKRINASISDLASLSLHALEISIPDASLLPENSLMFNNIKRFKIFVPNNLRYKPPGKFPSTNVLQLTGDAYYMKASRICKLMCRTEDLSLMKVRNAMNVMFQQQVCGFPRLQKMILSECDDLEYIIDMTAKRTLTEDISSFSNLETLHLSMLPNLKEIWHGSLVSLRSFENLSQIIIRFCNKLKYAFPLSIVKGSTRLKSIQILDCVEMNGIFYQDEEDGKELVLYSIEELHLHSLPKLVGCLAHVDDKISGVHDDSDPPRKNEDSFSMNKDVVSFTEKSVAFISAKLADTWMQDLRRLEVAYCDALQIIFSFEENHAIARAFNSLKELKLIGLHNLVHIWFQVPPEMVAFQNLQLLVISGCRNLYVFSPCVAKLLVQLQKLYINQCERMEEVVMKEKEESDDKILFPRLQFLECDYIPNLKVFYSGVVELPVLECLKINQCNKMKCISYKSTRAPKLERILINGSSCASMGDLNATIKRYTRNYIGKFGDDDYLSAVNGFDERYNIFDLLLNSPDKQDESDQQKPLNINDKHGESDEKNSMLEMLLNATGQEGESDEKNSMLEMLLNATGKEGESDEKNSMLEMLLNTLEKQGESIEKKLLNTPDKQGKSDEKDNILDMLLITPNKQGGSDDEFDGHDEIDLPDSTSTVDIYTCETNGQGNQSCIKEFAFADLKMATDNFSSDALLGRDGFSKVYKGWLDERTLSPSKPHSGMAVAIKKIFPDINHSVKNWQSEIYFLERLSHPNLIKLLGYCREDEEFLLVYEFMQRGSLADYFSGRNGGIGSLLWELRIKIAIGAARALTFLHNLENKVIHRDVKPSNIFLDGDYNTRIADFGSALWGPFNGDSLEATEVKGSLGYYDPGYVRSGRVTEKSDVYSFGVVLLQLMTGLMAIDYEVRNRRNLVARLKPILRHERELKDMMDSTMEGQYSSKAMLLMAKIVSRCLKSDHERRPTMEQVLQKLQQI